MKEELASVQDAPARLQFRNFLRCFEAVPKGIGRPNFPGLLDFG
jgi:hypothetical protein